MKTVVTIGLFLVVSVFAGDSTYPPLEEKLEKIFGMYNNQGKVGLSVYSTKKKRELHNINADSLFRPASTLKLLVTSTALQMMGVEYKPETELVLKGALRGTRFHGAVTVIGGGDPNISSRYFGDALSAFAPWIDSLKSLGIDTLQGTFLFDHSFYPDPFRPSTWKDEFFLSWYGAEISALAFNDNCVDVSVNPGAQGTPVVVTQKPGFNFLEVDNRTTTVPGTRRRITYILDEKTNKITLKGTLGVNAKEWRLAVPVKNPPKFFKAALEYVLDQNGIAIVSDSMNTQLETSFVKRFKITTAPLLSLLDEINQRSQNLHAEMLLRNLGGHQFSAGSLAFGIKAEQQFLLSLGIDSSQYELYDGSGLSYDNRISPRAMTSVLFKMQKHPKADLFYRSLAVPGISGVSGKRLPSLKYKNRVRFKTGFVNFTQGLVGYIQTSTNDTLSVALYLNEYKMDDWNAQKMMDSLWCEIVYHYNQEQESVLKARELWHSVHDTVYHSRLDTFSALLKGEPYVAGPTGEGVLGTVEQKPLINMRGFDCVTFIESAMALARAHTADSILSELTKIRYKDSQIYYSMRKHYFIEDWIRSSPELVSQLRIQGDTLGVREMDKKGFYESKNWQYKYENPQTELNYLPLDSAIDIYGSDHGGEERILGVGLVGKYPKIWVTHTGFLVLKPGKKPIFRHASFTNKKVEDVPFAEYLKTRVGSIIGIVLFEFIEPGAGK